jgi:hypothetical protein
MATIEGSTSEVTAEAVVVAAAAPLTVLSSAVAGGGLGRARAIVNLHVDKELPVGGAEVRLDAFAARRDLPAPWVGLLTAAWTEHACVAVEHAQGVGALVVVTVGLSNPIAAGWSAAAGDAARHHQHDRRRRCRSRALGAREPRHHADRGQGARARRDRRGGGRSARVRHVDRRRGRRRDGTRPRAALRRPDQRRRLGRRSRRSHRAAAGVPAG